MPLYESLPRLVQSLPWATRGDDLNLIELGETSRQFAALVN